MRPLRLWYFASALSLLSACGARVIIVDGVSDAAVGSDVATDVAPPPDAPVIPRDVVQPPVDVPLTPRDVPIGVDVVAPGSTCDLATPLPLGSPTPAVVRGGRETLLACNGIPPVQPIYYTVTVPAGQTLLARASRAVGGAPVLPQILQSCRARTCLGEPMAEAGGGESFVARWTNRADAAQLVIVTFGTTEPADTPFLLFAQLEGGAPSMNDVCARAEPVVSGQVVTASTVGATTPVPACPGSGLQGGVARWYRVTVPAGATLEAESLGGASALLRAYSDCGAVPACIAVNFGAQGATLRWTNPARTDQSVVLAVSLSSAGIMGEASVRVRTLSPAGNGLCANASRLTLGVATSGVLEPGGEAPAACAGEGAAQPGLFYRVRVPAGQSLSATYAAVGGIRRPVAVRVASACGGACASSNSASLDGTSVVARWTNATGSDVDAVVSVAPLASAGATQDFTLTATLSTPPTNVSCEAARTVVDGATLSGQDLSVATVVQPPCPGMTGGGATSLYYAAVVPRGQTLFVGATPEATGRLAPTIRVIPACGSNVCFAASSNAGTASSAAFFNAGADQRVLIAVGVTDARFAVPFTLSIAIRPPAANGVCASALAVSNGTSLVGQNLADGREAPSACATPGREGNALYYSVRVGAGEQLTVLASRAEAGIAPTLRLFSACGDTACLARSSQSGTSSRLSYTNVTGAAQTLRFAMNLTDGGATPAARANLAVSVSRPPYTVTTIPADCDSVTGGVLADALGDDVGTASLPLPFPFTYFGQPVSGWSASTNGYLQLWTTMGRSVGALGATELPSATAPGGMVAPFWDDLIVTSGLGDIRAAEVSAGGRHLTVQWTRAQFCCNASSADRLTFQAKLFASGAVEFHYCDLSGMPRVNGSAASIGMQDPAALRGVSYAARRADAVRTGFGLRFTP